MCENRHGPNCDCRECVEARMGRKDRCCGEDCMRDEDPLEMWHDAFHDAYYEVLVDIMKSKIKSAWGKHLEKGADLAIESMMQEMKENSRRKTKETELRAKVEKLLKEVTGE